MPMLKDPSKKYKRFKPIHLPNRQWPDKVIEKAPRWLATDLRDGNQSLPDPMDGEQKFRFFQKLVEIGYKEIEVSFPAASQTDFDFTRRLVETPGVVPDDVWLQVLAPCREDIIQRTVDSLKGSKKAILHIYLATSPCFRRIVFNTNKEQSLEMAVRCTKFARSITKDDPNNAGTEWHFEFSPETFSDTEPEFAAEVCEAVKAAWEPTEDAPIIFNLPATVEMATPNVFADQIEFFCRHVTEREKFVVSVHPHNDRGCAVAAAELAQMAGAQRVEGTLFGNGERTGNVDLVTLALNLYTQGVSPHVDFSDLNSVIKLVEESNKIPVNERWPYGGQLVVCAFSGSHQDAIKKGFKLRDEAKGDDDDAEWEIPYLPLDPEDIGRNYEAVIRVNSQSGKGGAAWIILRSLELDLPRALQVEFSKIVQRQTEAVSRELRPKEIVSLFEEAYHLKTNPRFNLVDYNITTDRSNSPAPPEPGKALNTKNLKRRFTGIIEIDGVQHGITGVGPGAISALASALSSLSIDLDVVDYKEHSISTSKDAQAGRDVKAATYIQCTAAGSKEQVWGVGIHQDVVQASLIALLSAASSFLTSRSGSPAPFRPIRSNTLTNEDIQALETLGDSNTAAASLAPTGPKVDIEALTKQADKHFPTPAAAAGSGVIGIDVGTEYLKATLVKPGIPLEIVPTKDSKRKETAAVAFKPTGEHDAPFPERFYGGDALGLAARYPDDVYSNLKSLLGVPFNVQDETIQAYQHRYPALRLEAAPGERGTVGLRSNRLGEAEKKEAFLVEELLAMQLKQVKANAENLAGTGSNIRDAVITYPSFYTAEEKRSLELAAQLAGLDVNAFVSDGLAVGLNYATSRTFPSVSEGHKPEIHVVYDMGAGSTTANVLRFQGRAVKDVGRFNKTVQEVQVLGSAWDKTLGGDALNDLIVNDMAENLAEDKKLKGRVTPETIKGHGKTMARFWKDAEKLRQILSANTEIGTGFESLYQDDLDFKYRITRAKFEQLAEQHIARVGGPLEKALAAAGLQLNDVDSIILHGGAIRTPFVQKELERVCGTPNKLRTSVNADEASAFGAAFKGAALSPSFRVKDIRASDASAHAVSLKWASEGKERQQKLFTPTSQVGPEKQVTLKNLDDFELSFHQHVLSGNEVAESPVLAVQTQNLTASVAKLKENFGCTDANITTKFSVRLGPVDGLPEVVSAFVGCEVDSKKGIVEDVKGFFGLGSKKEGQAPLGEDGEPRESITLESEEPQASTTSASDASSTATAETKKATPQTKLETIPISFKSSQLGISAPSVAELSRINARLDAFDASDRDRILREEALNELEAFIYRSRDLVENDEFVKALKADQLNSLKELSAAASDWLYGDGADAKTAEFQEKLKSLKDIAIPALQRKQESSDRPARVELMKEVLKNAKTILDIMDKQIKQDEDVYSSQSASSASSSSTSSETASSASESPSSSTDSLEDLEQDSSSSSTKTSSTTTTPKPTGPKYTLFQPTDLASLSKTYESTNSWFETSLAQQEKLTESDDPSFTVAEVDSRLKELDRILGRLYGKMGAGSAKSDKSTKKDNGNGKKQKKEKEAKKEKTNAPPKKDEL